MSYPQRGGKPAARKYPFSDSDFSMGISGTKKTNDRVPVASFSSAGSAVFFNAAFLAEGDKQFGMKLTFKQMGRFIRTLELVANHPVNEAMSVTLNLQFPKDGKWNHSGNSLTVGRNAAGIIYFTPGNKQIETCHFKLTVENDTRLTNQEKMDIDAGLNSKIEALRYVDFLRGRLEDWIAAAVRDGQAEAAANAGAGGGNSYPSNNNHAPQGGYNEPAKANDDSMEFIPF